MFNFLKISTLSLLFFFSFNLHAQISAADEKGTKECYDACIAAFEKSDANALCQWFTDNAEHVGPMGDIVRGRDNLIAYYTHLFEWFSAMPKPDRTETKVTNMQSRYLATDLVQVTYTEDNIRYYSEKAESDKFSCAVVLRKTKGKWLIELLMMTPVQTMPPATNK